MSHVYHSYQVELMLTSIKHHIGYVVTKFINSPSMSSEQHKLYGMA